MGRLGRRWRTTRVERSYGPASALGMDDPPGRDQISGAAGPIARRPGTVVGSAGESLGVAPSPWLLARIRGAWGPVETLEARA